MLYGEYMRRARKRAGLAIKGLAQLANVGRNTVWQIENGKNSPRLDTVIMLADALGISIDEFTGHKIRRKVI